jgi:hypothetical protein
MSRYVTHLSHLFRVKKKEACDGDARLEDPTVRSSGSDFAEDGFEPPPSDNGSDALPLRHPAVHGRAGVRAAVRAIEQGTETHTTTQTQHNAQRCHRLVTRKKKTAGFSTKCSTAAAWLTKALPPWPCPATNKSRESAPIPLSAHVVPKPEKPGVASSILALGTFCGNSVSRCVAVSCDSSGYSVL